MKPAIKVATSFFVAALAGALLGISSGASAWWVRQHASSCMTLGGSPIDLNFSIQNDSPTSNMVLLCSATDNSTTSKQTTNTMNVHGYDDHSTQNVSTLACRATWNVAGGACQTGPSSSGIGNYGLTIPTGSVWTAATAADFGYVYVNLPVREGSAFRSNLRGSFQAGP